MITSQGSALLVDYSDKESQKLWQALKLRDRRFDSLFVYGVKSTKVYCRPSCVAKKPIQKDQVSFFHRSDEARLAGFRPCLRCKPHEPEKESAIEIIQRMHKFIDENSKKKLTLRELGQESGLSPFYFHRTFKKVMGISPKEYLEAARIMRLKSSLKRGNSVRKSTYDAGYNTSGWLYFRPEEKLGMNPSDYKNGAAGLTIEYIISDCPLGRLLVGVTRKGICIVSINDSDQKLVSYLKSEYPYAKLVEKPRENLAETAPHLSYSLERILEYLNQGTDLEKSKFPLDLYATTFQLRVWKELRAIPYGKVRSYSEVARRLGSPRSTRAVANAVASNPVPLVIPCHRVVPKGGGVGEYGLGAERKRILLLNEGVNIEELETKRRKDKH